jgi:hypothetical protein
MVGELASLPVRFHEGQSGDSQARDEEEENGGGRGDKEEAEMRGRRRVVIGKA